jgi:predicted nuclease of predicted toxin-antitoxin system
MSRILADENIPLALSQALRAANHDVVSIHDLQLQGAPDEDVLKAANKDARILLTADKDFGLILELGPLAGRGRVILLRYQILDWVKIAAELTAALEATAAEFTTASALLIVVSEGQYRIRRWTGSP